MSIRVSGPNGETFEFPDGTSPQVIQSALQGHYAEQARQSERNLSLADAAAAAATGPLGMLVEAGKRYVRGRAESGEAEADYKRDDGFLDRAGSLIERGTQSAMGGANRVAGAVTGNVAVTNRARTLEEASNAEIAGTTSWEDVKNADGIGSMIVKGAKFGLETGIQSLPEMLITAVPGVGLATETAIQAGRIGQQRAQSNGTGDATIGDVVKAAPFAAASTYLEKLGIRGVTGKVGATAAGRIGVGTVTEAGTEFLQSMDEYAGGTVGTVRGFDVAEAVDQGLAGLVGGAVSGAALSATDEGATQGYRRITNRPIPPGVVEEEAAITQDDVDSPLPTELIAKGKTAIAGGAATAQADEILSRAGMPAIATPVEVTLPGGRTLRGTVADAFQTDAGEFGQSSGVKIALEDGTTFAEHFDDIADGGVTIRPVNQTVEEINAELKARADQAEAKAQQAMEAYQASAETEANILPPSKSTEAEIDDRTPVVSQPVDQAIADFKARARRAESGGNDNAKNPRSSAAGRYQFTNGTWLATYKAEFGQTGENDAQILTKKTDAGLQERLMDRLTRDNARELGRIGVPINSATLYTAHFAGIGGAKKLYTADKDEAVEAVLGAAVVKANPFLRGMTVGQAIDDLARRIGSKAPSTPSVAGDTPSPTPQEEGPNPFEKALADYQRETEEAAAREATKQPASPEILAPLTPEAPRETEDVTPGAVAAPPSPGDVAEAGGARPVDGGQPAESSPLRALIDSKKSQDVRGDPIDKEWTRFKPESGTLAIPRDEMPQIKAENRGAMVNFLNARGVQHSEGTIAATDLKPTQQEFSEAKVQKARDYEGGNRAILVSRDGHVLDGHHQWMAARDAGENIRAIVLDAPIRDLINTVREMPSVETAKGEDVPEVQPASTAERPAAVGEPITTAEVSPGTTAAADFAPPQQPAAAVRPPIPTVPQTQPTEDVAITPAGREIPVNYAVVDLKDLVTSHTQDGAINPAFPAALQPRDRTRDASAAQIAEIAAKLDPRLLGKSVKASDGAPIISPEGIVESGNGRTLALGRAYQLGGEKIEAYRQFIKDQGFNVEGVDQPVLVRVRGDMGAADVEAFTREANQRDTAGFSATEQAVSDAAALPGSMLDLYRGGDIDTAGNREFVRKFMEAVVPTNERANMISADGAVSQDAMRRIGAALLQRAYGNEQLVAKLNEATDSNIKSIGGALADVSAAWAKMREAASEGRIDPAMDITANLNEAVEIVDRARREGVKVADLVNQRDIFSGQTVDPMTEAVLRLMFRNPSFTQPYSRQKLAEQLGWYVDEAMKTSAGEDLFGGATKPTPGAILALAGDKFGEQQTTQESLFGRSQQADAGDGGGVRQDGRAGERAGEGVSEQRREEGGAEGEWVNARFDQEPNLRDLRAPEPDPDILVNTDTTVERENAVWDRLADRLDKMNVDERVRLSVQTWIDRRGRVAGQFGTIGNGEAVIRVAMNNGAQTPEMTLDHEVVHALKWLGNFKDTEWTRLSKDALADTEMMASIRLRYPDYDETDQIEEAIADRYMKWRAGQEEKGFVRAAFERVREFFRALGQLLRREGFTTSEAVFRAIARGDVGGRAVGEPQPINGDRNMVVYHGSPHDFDEFSLGAIGSGEGAQAYGWGLYFAGKKEIAQHYRQSLRKVDTGAFDRAGIPPSQWRSAEMFARQTDPKFPEQAARDFAAWNNRDDADSLVGAFTEAMADKGRLYEVDIPEDGEYLLWDAPLSEQPEQVKAALLRIPDGAWDQVNDALDASGYNEIDLDDDAYTGRDLYKLLARAELDVPTDGSDGKQDASLLLRQLGIAGIKYLDGSSRKDGDGTYNYVLFDDSRAKVISKYSITDAPFERTADDSPGGISQPQTNAIIAGMGDGSKWDAIRDKIDDWRIIVQDKMLPVLRQQEAVARSLGRKLAESENPYLAEELMTGKVGAQLEVLSEEMIDPLFQAMHENGVTVDELETYAYAQHAPERNAQIAKINPEFTEGTGSGMTDTQAAAILKRAERAGKADVLNALANQMRAILQEAKRIRVEAGLLSEEEAAAWDSTYEFYVPLRGRAEVDGDASRAKDRVRTQSGMSVRGKESKRAFGRKSQADNILAYTILQAEEAIVRAEKNRVAQSFLRLASASPNPDFWEVNKVRRVPVMDKTSGLVRYELQTRLAAEDADYTVVAKVNGDEMRVTLNRDNPQAVKVAEAMRNLDAPKFNRVMAAAATFNRYFSAINTRYNPSFVITNALRDLQTMAVVSQQFDLPNFSARVVRDYFPAMLAGKRGDGEWAKWRREWELAGGKVYYNQAGDLDQIRKDIETRSKRLASPNFAAKAWTKTFDALEAMNDSVERAVRLAVYKNARELGKSKAEAASMARNVTVNFTRKGKIGPAMNAFYAFFNASTQGSANLILAGVRSRKVRRAMAGFIVAGFLSDMLNSMLSGDDDDGESFWDKVPDFEKSRNVILMLPGADAGRAIKFPIAYGLNALFGLGRKASAMMRGALQPGEAALGSALEFIDAFNPFGNASTWQNILAPTALDPVIDISENKDFAGKPIQPEQNPFEPPVTPSSNYFPSASAWAKSITQALNSATGGDEVLPGAASVSPEVLEYLTGYITGGAGRFVNDFANIITAPGDPEAELTIRDVPIAKTLVTQKSPWIDKSLYYERVREVEATLDHAKQYKERGDTEALARFAEENAEIGQMEGVTKEASKLMREVRKARNEASFAHELGRIDDATYRQQIDRVKEAESRIISAYNARWTATMEAAEQ